MEIEAKWSIDSATYDRLVAAFPNRSVKFGYEIRVRWGGISRLFSDVYYDTFDSVLAQASHSIRHRSRSTSDPRAPNNSLASLQSARWVQDWQRVQYKSTPCRLGAVWFRLEAGDCRIADADSDGSRLCVNHNLSADTVLSGDLPSHAALRKLGEDHPRLLLSQLAPILEVIDYRYRVEFRKTVDGEDPEPVLELSLDRVQTKRLANGVTEDSLEAELELIAADPDEEALRELLAVAAKMQEEFSLTPSTRSKGALEVSECGAGSEFD